MSGQYLYYGSRILCLSCQVKELSKYSTPSFLYLQVRFSGKNRLSLLKFKAMTFDNSKQIISLRIKLFVATVLFLVYIALAYVAKLIEFPLLGLNDTAWTLIFVAVYLVIAFFPMVLNYQYVYFSDGGENIVFRYFTTGIIGGRKNSIEINKKTFAGFKTESRYFGLILSVLLFQQIGQKIAKYPPVHISALRKDQRNKVLKSLSQYAPRI
jgi:hypothetical protein